ncbi:hypothetical protein ma740 [Moumouvirus australiensis]|uniref:Uncharacterized protein n=1 Tax=Moumouvirus australiensis TaxID=2109587 RepID=A0A2P1EMJ5_9VIRU|nr:hypothetical protein QKC55_gp164 [Moumouvirus australiensis]AVL95127.1 hypothetical protein ma740 [Moumouvirus australiensis]
MGNISSSGKNLSDVENQRLQEVINKTVISIDQKYDQIATCLKSKRVRNSILDVIKYIFKTCKCNEYSLVTEIVNMDIPILYVYTSFYRKSRCIKRIRMSFQVCRDLQDIIFKFNTY